MSMADDPKPRVLVVDDDPTMLLSLEVVLGDDYAVVPAESARQALELADDSLSAVVLDVRLGAEDGYWACEALRQRQPDLPVIFHTAYPMALPREELFARYRPFGYLTKEGNLKKLLEAVAEAVDARALVRAQRARLLAPAKP